MSQTHSRLLRLLERYGRGTTSFQILLPGLRYWFEDDDSCIAYADTGGAWVTAGGPIAPPHREVPVMERFAEAARNGGRRVCFFGLEREPGPGTELRALRIGEQPVWDPGRWQEVLGSKRSLREQLRRARAKGVSVRRLEADGLGSRHGSVRREIDAMLARWLDTRAMAPMGFVVRLDPYICAKERRLLIAERNGVVVGMLAAVPIYARRGWFFENVVRDPVAPNGTVELMFDAAMRTVAADGSRYATLGLVPLVNPPARWMRLVRDHTRWLYDFAGLTAFAAKLEPDEWHPVYLGYPKRERSVRAVADALTAFARGSVIRFGWETVLHRARRVSARKWRRVRPRCESGYESRSREWRD